jgi:hypothetical protein
VTEEFAPYVVTVPTTNGDKPLPCRAGTRSMLPTTWLGRGLRVEYTDAGGHAATTDVTLLDWCPFGPILLIAGARTIVGWDRLVLVELAGN